MKIYAVLQYEQEGGPGAQPSVKALLFRRERTRLEWVREWLLEQTRLERSPEGNPLQTYTFYKNGWTYWLELFERDVIE